MPMQGQRRQQVVNTFPTGGEAAATTTADTSGPMDVDTGLRSRRAEAYIL